MELHVLAARRQRHVVVASSGVLVAYELATGKPRWQGPGDGAGYSSPHLVVLDGVPQIVLLRGRRTTSFNIADGKVLWEHSWQPGASIVQPALIGTRDLLINHADSMGGQGLRRLGITRAGGGWNVEERWTSRGLKPYFNDLVVHEDHAFGFDGSILSCINIHDGSASGRAAGTATDRCSYSRRRICCWCFPKKGSWRSSTRRRIHSLR